MEIIEKIFYFLFPVEKIKLTHWYDEWRASHKSEFLITARIFFPIVSVTYFAHFYLLDRVENLQPVELWFNYRMSMSFLALLCFMFYITPALYKFKWYKLPTIFACTIFCYFQARTIIWHPEVPYIYAFAFVFISTLIFKLGLISSLTIASALISLMWPTFKETGQSMTMIMSASIVTFIFIIFYKSKLLSEVTLFLTHKEFISAQKKIIEMNLEFNNEIRSFLPRKIYNRINRLIKKERLNTHQAIDEVLRPKAIDIACLHTDIRGYTQSSKDLKGYIFNKALPDIKGTVDLVEDNHGVPRIIGDLVLAYYDSTNLQINIFNALVSASNIYSLNEKLNFKAEKKITRYIIIASGEALVGNIGGVDTREITALGSPVNLVSRIDELTKKLSSISIISPNQVILSQDAFSQILSRSDSSSVQYKELDLTEVGLEIRDFPEEKKLFLLPMSTTNMNYFRDIRRILINNTHNDLEEAA